MSGQALNLPTCACLLLRVPGTPDDAVRPYTPISEEARLGSFDLLVKRYPEGAASQYLHGLAVGDTVGFKHVAPNVKRQHPFGVRSISMLCAGSGVTPLTPALALALSSSLSLGLTLTLTLDPNPNSSP